MIAVLGSGAFGTALAVSLARSGQKTALWARAPEHAEEMRDCRENERRLAGVGFPKNLEILLEIESIRAESICLLAVPMQQLAAFLKTHPALKNMILVLCCKGIDLKTGLSPSEIVATQFPDARCAILTGPSFARDIAKGLPTALTLACADSQLGKSLQAILTTENIRLYRTNDVKGAELGGAMKNVIAIACGAAMGAGLGESARAALMTRGFAEISRFATAIGARQETLAGLSGFGDLTLTCTSEQSRNYQFGLSLGLNRKIDPTITVEGAATARAITKRARDLHIDMPISDVVVAVQDGELQVKEAMADLLSRTLKEE